MKKILMVFSIIFLTAGILLVSCQKQDTTPKTEGTAEKGMVSEKARDTMDTVKETVSEYGEKAEEMAESYTEKAGEVVESTKEAVSSHGEQAKEKVYGYTEPVKEAVSDQAEKTGEMIEKSKETMDDYGRQAEDALGNIGK